MLSKSRDSVCVNIYISAAVAPKSWYLKSQTHDRGRDGTERVMQAEEQSLERVQEGRARHQHSPTAAELGVSQFVRLHPYHVQKLQDLEPPNFPCRIIYCEWLLQQCRERPNFLTGFTFN